MQGMQDQIHEVLEKQVKRTGRLEDLLKQPRVTRKAGVHKMKTASMDTTSPEMRRMVITLLRANVCITYVIVVVFSLLAQCAHSQWPPILLMGS